MSVSQQIIQLPPVHVFALSVGCCIALELSFAHPDIVRSLTLCSPLSPTEVCSQLYNQCVLRSNYLPNQPEDIATGRLEIYEYWTQSVVHEGSSLPKEKAKTTDPLMLDDCFFGTRQLLFNNSTSRIVDAYEDLLLP